VEPEDIENKEFMVSLRGYDKDEVREFLTEVAAAFRTLSSADQPTAPDDAVSAEVATVMRSIVSEAVNIRLEAEREAAEIRAAAQENAGTRLWKAFTGLRGAPPEH
jgi:DivIVA domain-containing protein